jgi:L-malate glycosyltransferase
LLDLLGALPPDFEATVACPAGELSSSAGGLGLTVTPISEISGSLRLHPLHTPIAASQLGRAIAQVARAAKDTGADLIVASSLRAGIVTTFAAGLAGRPTVVHVQDCLPRSPVANSIRRLIGARAAVVIANSRYTAANFAAGTGFAAKVRVAYNPVDGERFDPSRVERTEVRERLRVAPSEHALAVIAQITPWKGQDTALEALALLRKGGRQAKLLLVGEPRFTSRATRHDNLAYFQTLRRMTADLGLEDDVRFAGQRDDVAEILAALDALLVPSWEEPFGTIVAEAMTMGTPVIATEVGGPAEIIEDGRTGLLVPPRDPHALAAAVNRLLKDERLGERLAQEARRTATRFALDDHVATVSTAYRDALGTDWAAAG